MDEQEMAEHFDAEMQNRLSPGYRTDKGWHYALFCHHIVTRESLQVRSRALQEVIDFFYSLSEWGYRLDRIEHAESDVPVVETRLTREKWHDPEWLDAQNKKLRVVA